MIRFEEAELSSVLPHILSSDPNVAAISYAYKMAMKRIIDISIRTSLFANIDKMNDDVLDLMALELRTQYYDESLPILKKRALIKQTLKWHSKSGTVSAVQELIDTVLESGEIVEWFDMNPPGSPFTFGINTTSDITKDSVDFFNTMLSFVKPARANLSSINLGLRIDGELKVATGITTMEIITVGGENG